MKRLLLISCFLCCSVLTVAQEKAFKVGDSVPDFKLWLTDGTRLTQENSKDKVVVFKFWFTSCMPCIIDIPPLNKLVSEFENRDDIIFIAPALDRKDAIEKFLYNRTFKFKIAYSAMDVSQVFNKKQVYPSYYVIDKKGKFVYVDVPTKTTQTEALKKAINKALKV